MTIASLRWRRLVNTGRVNRHQKSGTWRSGNWIIKPIGTKATSDFHWDLLEYRSYQWLFVRSFIKLDEAKFYASSVTRAALSI